MIIMKFRFVFLLVGFLVFLGCSPWTAKVMSGERGFPKEPKFTILPQGNYENCRLDFNAIYYYRFGKNLTVPEGSCKYYRFWPNGRALFSYSDSLPTRAKAEDFYRARIGYYQVTGKDIVIELFIPDSGIMNWDYIRSHAVIDNEGNIVELRSEIRGDVTEFQEIYLKRNLGELKRQPDW